MLRAMVFIDFENFDIAKFNYYKEKCLLEAQEEAKNNGTTIPTSVQTVTPKLDFNKIPKEIVNQLSIPHILVKTFLFASKPDQFLMQDSRRSSTYNWINGLKNQDFFTVVEGTHSARPVSGFTYKTMSLSNPASYYVEEKGTDVNLAAHVISKGLHNAFDTAIIMSGDTDYIPVMDIMNSIGKNIVVVGVKGQNLFQFKHHSDAQIIIDDAFFQKCLRT